MSPGMLVAMGCIFHALRSAVPLMRSDGCGCKQAACTYKEHGSDPC
jgi:hypothetical protein